MRRPCANGSRPVRDAGRALAVDRRGASSHMHHALNRNLAAAGPRRRSAANRRSRKDGRLCITKSRSSPPSPPAFGLALVFGFLAARLKLPALVGYLLAGVIIGPFTPGFVADAEIAAQLAEIGVMLLMFGVGLHFSLDDLLAVRKIALPGALVQIAVATALGAALRAVWGWSARRRAGVRPRAVGRQHGRAAAGAGERAASWTPSTAASRSAG